jgi:hypothetical protein
MDDHEVETSRALIPTQVSQIEFYGDAIVVVLVEMKGERLAAVPLRQFCEYLGVDWSGQRQRLLRDEELAEEIVSVAIPAQTSDLVLAEERYDYLLGVTTLVREHLEILTGMVVPISDKLDYAVHLLESLVGQQDETHKKLAKIDERTQRLTPTHARNVAEFVEQMVAETAKAPTPLDHYKIYGRLKHRFRSNSYKEVPDERFGEVMTYLRELLRQALSGELPQQGSLF